MPAFVWRRFLEGFSREVLADDQKRARLPTNVIKSQWLGFTPATLKEVGALQRRLGIQLPPSYRDFLKTTNGWRVSGWFIDELRPTRKVRWFADENQEWIDANLEPTESEEPVTLKEHKIYGDAQDTTCFRVEFLKSCLQISDRGDSAVYLLNPEVQTRSGEWEAWFFANWLPGAKRFRSFPELMKSTLDRFIKLRDKQKNQPDEFKK